MESHRRPPADHNEGDQRGELRHDERRFRLRRRQRLQRRQLAERLDDADEDVEVQRRRRGHDVDPPPRAGEPQAVEREQRQRDDPERAGRIEAVRRQRETGGAGQDRGDEEQRGPAGQRAAGRPVTRP